MLTGKKKKKKIRDVTFSLTVCVRWLQIQKAERGNRQTVCSLPPAVQHKKFSYIFLFLFILEAADMSALLKIRLVHFYMVF